MWQPAAPTFMPPSGHKSHQKRKAAILLWTWLQKKKKASRAGQSVWSGTDKVKSLGRQQIDIFNMRVQIDKVN